MNGTLPEKVAVYISPELAKRGGYNYYDLAATVADTMRAVGYPRGDTDRAYAEIRHAADHDQARAAVHRYATVTIGYPPREAP